MMTVSSLPETGHVSSWLDLMRCPACAAPIAWSEADCACLTCPQRAWLVDQRIVSFLQRADPVHEEMLAWPVGWMDWVAARLDAAARGDLDQTSRAELAARGLLDTNGNLTTLGDQCYYHHQEYGWQKDGDPLQDLLRSQGGLSPGARVLDVGCGAGQTLRLMASVRPALRIGLDNNLSALALGCHLTATAEQREIRFVCQNGHRLPFRDGSFSHVVSRVGLNYMHQRTALTEMVRVLECGGFVCCRFEALGHDLSLMREAKSLRRHLALLRDLAIGLIHDRTGWQRTPGNRLTGGRAFASLQRLIAILRTLGCRIIDTQMVHRRGRVAGFARQMVVLAQKSQ